MTNQYLSKWKNEKKLISLSLKTKLSIIDQNSLTNRLMYKDKHGFTVNVLNQECRYFNQSMKCNLPNKVRGVGIYRKVILSTNCYPKIEAYTFMLIKHVSGKERFLKILGSRSLGTYILNPKRFKKKSIVYKRVGRSIHRISIYNYRYKNIYLNEIFPDTIEFENISYLNARGKFTK